MFEEDLVLRPEKGGNIRFLSSLYPPGNEHSFKEYPEHFRPQNRWIIKISILVIKFFHSVAKPMEWIGSHIEFILNLLSNNGGLTGIIYKLLRGHDVIKPKRGTENFISFIGHLDGRLDLHHTAERIIESGSTFCKDISVMASKLAYENESVIRNVVTKCWKMHFVEFFNCWNEFLGTMSTQAFIFCDKAENANLVVIAFRGTEPFNANDWSTDFDISLYKMESVGRVHLGNGWPENAPIDHEKPLAYYAIRSRLENLLEEHQDAKFIVTGHSLGGALAVLFPVILNLHNRKRLLEKMLAVYTFGQPRVGDEDMGNYWNKNINQPEQRYFRVVYCNDMVPRLPYDNNVFLFKHFGECMYYNSFYKQKTLKEEPNKNFSPLYCISIYGNAIWELMQSVKIGFTEGKGFREEWFGMVFRCMGIVLPGISAHSPVNYVNAVRLGKPLSNYTAVEKKGFLKELPIHIGL